MQPVTEAEVTTLIQLRTKVRSAEIQFAVGGVMDKLLPAYVQDLVNRNPPEKLKPAIQTHLPSYEVKQALSAVQSAFASPPHEDWERIKNTVYEPWPSAVRQSAAASFRAILSSGAVVSMLFMCAQQFISMQAGSVTAHVQEIGRVQNSMQDEQRLEHVMNLESSIGTLEQRMTQFQLESDEGWQVLSNCDVNEMVFDEMIRDITYGLLTQQYGVHPTATESGVNFVLRNATPPQHVNPEDLDEYTIAKARETALRPYATQRGDMATRRTEAKALIASAQKNWKTARDAKTKQEDELNRFLDDFDREQRHALQRIDENTQALAATGTFASIVQKAYGALFWPALLFAVPGLLFTLWQASESRKSGSKRISVAIVHIASNLTQLEEAALRSTQLARGESIALLNVFTFLMPRLGEIQASEQVTELATDLMESFHLPPPEIDKLTSLFQKLNALYHARSSRPSEVIPMSQQENKASEIFYSTYRLPEAVRRNVERVFPVVKAAAQQEAKSNYLPSGAPLSLRMGGHVLGGGDARTQAKNDLWGKDWSLDKREPSVRVPENVMRAMAGFSPSEQDMLTALGEGERAVFKHFATDGRNPFWRQTTFIARYRQRLVTFVEGAITVAVENSDRKEADLKAMFVALTRDIAYEAKLTRESSSADVLRVVHVLLLVRPKSLRKQNDSELMTVLREGMPEFIDLDRVANEATQLAQKMRAIVTAQPPPKAPPAFFKKYAEADARAKRKAEEAKAEESNIHPPAEKRQALDRLTQKDVWHESCLGAIDAPLPTPDDTMLKRPPSQIGNAILDLVLQGLAVYDFATSWSPKSHPFFQQRRFDKELFDAQVREFMDVPLDYRSDVKWFINKAVEIFRPRVSEIFRPPFNSVDVKQQHTVLAIRLLFTLRLCAPIVRFPNSNFTEVVFRTLMPKDPNAVTIADVSEALKRVQEHVAENILRKPRAPPRRKRDSTPPPEGAVVHSARNFTEEKLGRFYVTPK